MCQHLRKASTVEILSARGFKCVSITEQAPCSFCSSQRANVSASQNSNTIGTLAVIGFRCVRITEQQAPCRFCFGLWALLCQHHRTASTLGILSARGLWCVSVTEQQALWVVQERVLCLYMLDCSHLVLRWTIGWV